MTEEEIRQAQAARLRQYRMDAGFKFATEAARRYGWPVSSYTSHENGTRKMGDDDADRYAARLSRPGLKISGVDILYGPSERDTEPEERGVARVPVVGLVGAGAAVEPEFEQEDVLHEVELPFQVPVGLVGFEVRGDSMTPRYDEGDVILVNRDNKRSLESFYGEEAAVCTGDGRRYIKQILPGKSPQTVTLHSFNAKMIQNARVKWIGAIYATIRSGQAHRVTKRAAETAKRLRNIKISPRTPMNLKTRTPIK